MSRVRQSRILNIVTCSVLFLLASLEIQGQLYSRVSPKFTLTALKMSECVEGDDKEKCTRELKPGLSSGSKCPSGQNCKGFAACASMISAGSEVDTCFQREGLPGVCCDDVTKSDSQSTVLKEAVQDPKEKPNPRFAGSQMEFERAFQDKVKDSLNKGSDFVIQAISYAMESNALNGNAGQASISHFENAKPSRLMKEMAVNASINMWAAKTLADSNLVTFESREQMPSRARALAPNCSPDPICNPNAKYRKLDGSCNNLKVPKWGMAGTPLQRVISNDYKDGFFIPRVASNGLQLPSARFISTQLFNLGSRPAIFNSMFTAFGQFWVHDIVSVPVADDGSGRPPNCCPLNPNLAASLICLPIPVPSNDPVMGRFKNCLNFVRSLGGLRVDCQLGPQEQVNQVTAFLDLSAVYDVSDSSLRNLRLGKNGMLVFEVGPDGGTVMPGDNSGRRCGPTARCFVTGDGRANQQPPLISIQIIWFREHNRIAAALAKLNRNWDDEKVFQETRRIAIAEMQHVIYNEWLPILMGTKLVNLLSLNPLSEGFTNNYKDVINPSIVNGFSTAAARLHNLIPSLIRAVDLATGRNRATFELKSSFGNMDSVRGFGMIASLIKGLMEQQAEVMDNNVANDLLNNLFGTAPNGLDILAIHIQRGRDHGLPGYIKYRQICSTVNVTSFDDLLLVMSQKNVDQLKQTYANVADIDLIVGASLEVPAFEGAMVGNTILCLIADQFLRLKLGDRFYYEHGGQPGSFKLDQLESIRQTSLARIICDNVPEISSIQPLAFLIPNQKTNPLLNCNDGIPSVNLDLWKD